MHPELAPRLSPSRRRRAAIEAIVLAEQQIARLQLAQRHAIAALYDERGTVSEKFVADELALAWGRSSRQGRNRLEQALASRQYPAVLARVAHGSWLMDHADAVSEELAGTDLDREEQEQVLDLVLSRPGVRTPYELRQAVRMAVLALFPDHAWERAKKTHADRDVQTYPDAAGGSSLVASGSATDVAAMMASIDALCWPVAAGDTRTVAQRRFDAIKQLVCGQAQPGQWQVLLLAELTTVQGDDDRPAELVGHGPVAAQVARRVAANGELRRVVVDEHGHLVAVDSTVHRPDLAPPVGVQFPVHPSDDDHDEPVEPDPDAPSADDLAWLEAHTDRASGDAAQDRTRRARTARSEPSERVFSGTAPDAPVSPQPPRLHGLSLLEWAGLAVLPLRTTVVVPEPPRPGAWSTAGLARALRRMATDPVVLADLSTDRYVPPARLKRHLVLRDRTCIFPGCARRADDCDKDHLLEWPLGPTSELNLGDECEHHHQAKHHGFAVRRLPDGTFRWTTPSGHTYDRPPRPVLDNYRHRPPPEPEPG